MTGTRPPRVVVLLALDGAFTPMEIAASAAETVDIVFLLDAADREGTRSLHQIASALAPTEYADFGAPDACREAMRRAEADAAITFVDRLCALTARLNQADPATPPKAAWGRKDRQRELLREAGLSRVLSQRVGDESALRSFLLRVGPPAVVKPVDGVASRDLWLLDGDQIDRDLVETIASGQMFVEQFVSGAPLFSPHLGDLVSVEVFRHAPRVPGWSFVTDRLPTMSPCRETGLVLPSVLPTAHSARLSEIADTALEVLEAHRGAYHVEIKLASPDPEIIEVNGRMGGLIGRLVRYGAGADVGRTALLASVGVAEPQTLIWRRCVLLLYFLAPERTRRAREAPSRREISRLPGVFAVDEVCLPGQEIDRSAARLWIEADDHDRLRRRLIHVAEFLTSRFVFVDDTDSVVADASWLEAIAAT